MGLLVVRGVVYHTPVHRSPTIAVSVFFSSIARIDPTTHQLIGETCTGRYASTSAPTGELTYNKLTHSSNVIKSSTFLIIFKFRITFSDYFTAIFMKK